MRGRRGTLVAAGLALLVVVVLVWLVRPTGEGVPLDPRGTGPTGTAAMFRLAEQLGAQVTVASGAPDEGPPGTIVVLADRLDEPTREQVRERVRAGARLVLLDPASPLNPVPVQGQLVTDTFGVLGREPGCALLQGYADRVESARWVVLGAPHDATARCFPVGDGDGLVAAPLGEGEVVVTGAVDALVNRELGEADHAQLATALLAPEGGGRVTVVWDAEVGGDTPLLSLLPDGAAEALWLLGAGAVVLALSRARRHGPPVAERLPVRVPASELALAIGDLLGRGGHRDAAAARLRQDLRVEVAHALHLPPDTPPDVLVELLSERLQADDLDPAGLRAALLDGPVADDEALVAVASALARVRSRVRRPARSAGGAGHPQ